MLGVVFSFAGGIGAVAVKDSIDGTVSGVRAVTAMLEMPPLAGIPYIATDEDRQRRRLVRVGVVAAMIIVSVVVVAIVNLFYMPLDVLWFAMQRHLGLF